MDGGGIVVGMQEQEKKIQSRILRISFLICDILHRLDKEKKKSFFILFFIILEPMEHNNAAVKFCKDSKKDGLYSVFTDTAFKKLWM